MITTLGYSWTLSGEDFRPGEVERLTGLAFDSKHERGDSIGDHTDEVYPEGIACLTAPRNIAYWPLASDDELLNTIEIHVDLLRRSGVENLLMYCTFGYHAQCNLQFSPEELQRLTALGAALTISCMELDEETFERYSARDGKRRGPNEPHDTGKTLHD